MFIYATPFYIQSSPKFYLISALFRSKFFVHLLCLKCGYKTYFNLTSLLSLVTYIHGYLHVCKTVINKVRNY